MKIETVKRKLHKLLNNKSQILWRRKVVKTEVEVIFMTLCFGMSLFFVFAKFSVTGSGIAEPIFKVFIKLGGIYCLFYTLIWFFKHWGIIL